jgi:long-chain fatty acid transport protein
MSATLLEIMCLDSSLRRALGQTISFRIVIMLRWSAFALLFMPALAQASGFALTEQSASAVGRAGAVVASPQEPAAAWYNPAALAFMPETGVAVGGLLYVPSSRFEPAVGASVDSAQTLHLVPALYASHRVTDRLSVGLAINVPFALQIDWPRGWVGERWGLSTRLWALQINPSLAWRLGQSWSVAAGVSAVRGSVDIVTGLLPEMGEGQVNLTGQAWGWGANLAALWQPRFTVSAAVTYRRRVRLAFDGRATFSPEKPDFGAVDQGASAVITLPDLIVAGAQWRVRRDLTAAAEVGCTLWSTFDRLAIDFEQPSMRVAAVERGQHNPWSARAGVEWNAPFALVVRAGGSFDQSSATGQTLSPAGPDSQRIAAAAGVGYRLGGWGVDTGYMLAIFRPATATPPPVRADGYDASQSPAGTYRSRAHIAGLTVSWRR